VRYGIDNAIGSIKGLSIASPIGSKTISGAESANDYCPNIYFTPFDKSDQSDLSEQSDKSDQSDPFDGSDWGSYLLFSSHPFMIHAVEY
jgi:hypothetical protein